MPYATAFCAATNTMKRRMLIPCKMKHRTLHNPLPQALLCNRDHRSNSKCSCCFEASSKILGTPNMQKCGQMLPLDCRYSLDIDCKFLFVNNVSSCSQAYKGMPVYCTQVTSLSFQMTHAYARRQTMTACSVGISHIFVFADNTNSHTQANKECMLGMNHTLLSTNIYAHACRPTMIVHWA